MTWRRGLSRERLALVQAYTGSRCIYCGQPTRGPLACPAHAELLHADPHYWLLLPLR